MRRLVPVALLVALGLGSGGSSPEVTLLASPLVIRADAKVTLSGQISSGSANEYVAVQGSECGVPGAGFRSLSGALTVEGGGWTASPQYLQSTTKLRALWKGTLSREVTVRVRAAVNLVARPGNRFRVGAGGIGRFDGKRITIQRFDISTRAWRTVRTVIIRTSEYGGYAERDGIRLAVPRGTLLRAVLPLPEAKPCYLAGYSKLVRT